jgi:ubiquinone/menaquinone biosynthesis C-methylase UbiE
MLDALERRARAAGLGNVLGVLADAQHLPYPDMSFDAAYLITVLGEIPRPESMLRELRRVLKSKGRLVVGEMIADPDFVSPTTLIEQARVAGFTLDRTWGPGVAYLARFHVEPPDNSPQARQP